LRRLVFARRFFFVHLRVRLVGVSVAEPGFGIQIDRQVALPEVVADLGVDIGPVRAVPAYELLVVAINNLLEPVVVEVGRFAESFLSFSTNFCGILTPSSLSNCDIAFSSHNAPWLSKGIRDVFTHGKPFRTILAYTDVQTNLFANCHSIGSAASGQLQA
jgi:hypothetical protein